ncbi:hypothetical protein LOAG_00419 [Loa loa]|uniref:Uncharacterized protein n=1 Tax=Loa loa TaxID=7209 RepID=A0A1S0UBB6_LOALO|nr:hypothetical protein LOAG_00419 [Loa loa]EFO28065.1 hypothetical protein LOAG_00419 [Loa loa]
MESEQMTTVTTLKCRKAYQTIGVSSSWIAIRNYKECPCFKMKVDECKWITERRCFGTWLRGLIMKQFSNVPFILFVIKNGVTNKDHSSAYSGYSDTIPHVVVGRESVTELCQAIRQKTPQSSGRYNEPINQSGKQYSARCYTFQCTQFTYRFHPTTLFVGKESILNGLCLSVVIYPFVHFSHNNMRSNISAKIQRNLDFATNRRQKYICLS